MGLPVEALNGTALKGQAHCHASKCQTLVEVAIGNEDKSLLQRGNTSKKALLCQPKTLFKESYNRLQFYKTFCSRKLHLFITSQSACLWQALQPSLMSATKAGAYLNEAFVSGKPFQPSLMFVGKAKSPTQSGAPERCFTQVGSGLTCKHQTRL